jgi:hypothetical protein
MTTPNYAHALPLVCRHFRNTFQQASHKIIFLFRLYVTYYSIGDLSKTTRVQGGGGASFTVYVCSIRLHEEINSFSSLFAVCVGFEVLTAVAMSSIFWFLVLCSPLKCYRSFEVTYLLLLQGGRISQSRPDVSRSIYYSIQVDFLLGLLFYSEDGSAMFLRNVC